LDLPGVAPDSIELDVERNVVTVRAERPSRDNGAELIAAEQPRGVFSRQLILGDNLDTERIDASYDAGVLGACLTRFHSDGVLSMGDERDAAKAVERRV
jgi:HSP20 family protein